MSFEWQKSPDIAFGELGDAYADAIHTAVFQLAQRYAPEIEAWMKANASWQDRTGNARQFLSAEAADLTNAIVIAFGHGVEYGRFLEFDYGGRYAIIGPALDFFIPKIWADVQALLK